MPKHKLLLTILNNFLNYKSSVTRYGWIGTYYWSEFYISEAQTLLLQSKDNVTFLQILVNLYSRQIVNRHDRSLLRHIVFEVFVRLLNQNSLFPPEEVYTQKQFYRMVAENKNCQRKFGWLLQIARICPIGPFPIKLQNDKSSKIEYKPMKIQVDGQAQQLVYEEYLESIQEINKFYNQQTLLNVKYIQRILLKQEKTVSPCAFLRFDKIAFNYRLDFAVQNIMDINKATISFRFATNQEINSPSNSIKYLIKNNKLMGGVYDASTGLVKRPQSSELDFEVPPILLTVLRTDGSANQKQSDGPQMQVTVTNEIIRDGQKTRRIIGGIYLKVQHQDLEFWKINPLIIDSRL